MICEEDKRLVEELQALGQKTLNEEQDRLVESENAQILDAQENKENESEHESENSVNGEAEYIPSIRQTTSKNVSSMRVSDLDIRELCSLKPGARVSKSEDNRRLQCAHFVPEQPAEDSQRKILTGGGPHGQAQYGGIDLAHVGLDGNSRTATFNSKEIPQGDQHKRVEEDREAPGTDKAEEHFGNGLEYRRKPGH